MKARGTVFVSLVVALLVLGVSAGGAGAMSKTTRADAQEVREANARAGAGYAGRNLTAVAWIGGVTIDQGLIHADVWVGMQSLTAHKVLASCKVAVSKGGFLLGTYLFANPLPAYGWRTSHYPIEIPYQSGKWHLSLICKATPWRTRA